MANKEESEGDGAGKGKDQDKDLFWKKYEKMSGMKTLSKDIPHITRKQKTNVLYISNHLTLKQPC